MNQSTKLADVLIVGAGLAGATVAEQQTKLGRKVVVVEKARGSGGRLSSKRLEYEGVQLAFDLGADVLSATTPMFERAIDDWSARKMLLPQDKHALVASRSSMLTRQMLQGATCFYETRIHEVFKRDGDEFWRVVGETADGECFCCDARKVVITAPPKQCIDLLPDGHEFRDIVSEFSMSPKWVLLALVSVDELPKLWSENKAQVSSIISRVVYENIKRDVPLPEGWLCIKVEASREWSTHLADADPGLVKAALSDELKAHMPPGTEVLKSHLHRWLYAIPDPQKASESVQTKWYMDDGCLLDEKGLGVCGDYLAMSQSEFGLEAAWLSGQSLSEKISQSFVS